ncbi:hypothetical protein ACFLRP_00205 [Bacteroidota bacterium]
MKILTSGILTAKQRSYMLFPHMHSKQRHPFIEFLFGNWYRVLLWILLVTICIYGLNGFFLLFLDYGLYEYAFGPSFLVSVILVSWAFNLYFSQKNKTRRLKNALQIFRSCDKSVMSKLLQGYPDSYTDNRDIPLIVILERNGILVHFNNNLLFNQKIAKEAGEAWEDLDLYTGPYEVMGRLDRIVLSKLPTGINRKYPKATYYIRLHLLDDFMEAFYRREFLRYESSKDDIEEPIRQFANMVLNEFYRDVEGYEPQPVVFDKKQFEQYIIEEAKQTSEVD